MMIGFIYTYEAFDEDEYHIRSYLSWGETALGWMLDEISRDGFRNISLCDRTLVVGRLKLTVPHV